MSQLAERAACCALVFVAACASERATPDVAPPADTGKMTAAYPVVSDSLVLTAPGGATIWFSGARADTDSTGVPCLERGLVIVHGAERILVPLLMTGAAPALVNDSTIRARLWRNCTPGDRYDVDLRTGQPSRVR